MTEPKVEDWQYSMAGEGGLEIAVQLFEKKVLQDQLLTIQDHQKALDQENQNYADKINQQKIDQAEIYNYLNKKLEDNYAQIAELENKILAEQGEREREEDALEGELADLGRRLGEGLRALEGEVAGLQERARALAAFQGREAAAAAALAAREGALRDLRAGHAQERAAAAARAAAQAEGAEGALAAERLALRARFAEESVRQLGRGARRRMARNGKLEAEIGYQAREAEALRARAAAARQRNAAARRRLAEARHDQEALAQTSRYYQQLVKRVSAELAAAEAARGPAEGEEGGGGGRELGPAGRRALRDRRRQVRDLRLQLEAAGSAAAAARAAAARAERGYARALGAQADLARLLLWAYEDAVAMSQSSPFPREADGVAAAAAAAAAGEGGEDTSGRLARTIDGLLRAGAPSRTTGDLFPSPRSCYPRRPPRTADAPPPPHWAANGGGEEGGGGRRHGSLPSVPGAAAARRPAAGAVAAAAVAAETESWPEDQLIPADIDELTPKQRRMVIRMLLQNVHAYQNLAKDECLRAPPPDPAHHPELPPVAHRFPRIRRDQMGLGPAAASRASGLGALPPPPPLAESAASLLGGGGAAAAGSVATHGSSLSRATRATGIPSWDALRPTVAHHKARPTRSVAVQTSAPANLDGERPAAAAAAAAAREGARGGTAYSRITLFSVVEDDPGLKATKKKGGKGGRAARAVYRKQKNLGTRMAEDNFVAHSPVSKPVPGKKGLMSVEGGTTLEDYIAAAAARSSNQEGAGLAPAVPPAGGEGGGGGTGRGGGWAAAGGGAGAAAPLARVGTAGDQGSLRVREVAMGEVLAAGAGGQPEGGAGHH